jgi:hypothetical protein
MKTSPLINYLETEALRFKQLAQQLSLAALHKSPDGRSINELDARLIRDHEVRAETYTIAATIAAGHLTPRNQKP